MTFGQRLKELRDDKNISMAALGKIIGTSSSRISDWENGNTHPSSNFVVKISNYFKVTTDWLLKGVHSENGVNYFAENGVNYSTEIEQSYSFLSKCELNTHFDKLDEQDFKELKDFIDFLLYKKTKSDKSSNQESTKLRENEDIYLPSDKFIKLPILGNVAAGNPILAVENLDGYLEVPHSIGKGGDFILRVKGDSMTGVNINDGDYVIVKKQPHAESGQIVVAAIEHEATVKTLRYTYEGYILEPANSKYSPIVSTNAEIYGVVVGVYHNSF